MKRRLGAGKAACITLAAISAMAGPLAAQDAVRDAATPDDEVLRETAGDFAEAMTYMTRDGGTWLAANPDYAEGAPSHFGYRFAWSLPKRLLRFEIFGVPGEPEPVFWKGFMYWDPAVGSAVLTQVGADGSIGKGVRSVDADDSEVIDITFQSPGGKEFRIRDISDRDEADVFTSTTYRWLDGAWMKQQELSWERVPEE